MMRRVYEEVVGYPEFRELVEKLWPSRGEGELLGAKVRRVAKRYIEQRYPVEVGDRNPAYGEELLGLPNQYWYLVTEWLPGYEHRDDVLLSDICTRWLDGEEVWEEALEAFFEGKRVEEASDELIERVHREYAVGEWRLVLQSLVAALPR